MIGQSTLGKRNALAKAKSVDRGRAMERPESAEIHLSNIGAPTAKRKLFGSADRMMTGRFNDDPRATGLATRG
jgi:hypothetical protein